MSSPTPLLHLLREDLDVVVSQDPSVTSRWEALGHSGLSAVWAHRVAHRLYHGRMPTAARTLARFSRRRTGVEIHPGAVLGRRVFIDHGTSVVVGQTATVGDDVTIYQQVTLGAVGWWSDNARPAGERRHPAIGNGVILGANATVLGPVTIGDRALIGAMATVTEDIGPGARVYAPRSVVRDGPSPAAVPDGAPPAAPEAATALDPVRLLASAGSW
ncbi:serine O-acetyltransferase EpsC [Streptomyces sp. H27-S2]|uniref:serine O-acetyltransferase EpsC n=1 Tax=Streptomyces antarcticus TaxID=2996458 RepID=UPI002270C928|nr:serine O-acetyltransferase EpsC [Streptomyces sp. H27-S2]MCY0953007.1 DapH/DapD/GlmU-related protein [Streptomyces sp. H27-S2]